jgi:L-lactate dehydrogenase complex protein LldG
MTDTARQAILARIRKSLGATAADPTRIAVAAQRIADHPASLIPARASGTPEELLARFRSFLEGQQAAVRAAATAADVPAVVKAYLTELRRAPTVRMGADPRLAAMPWAEVTGLVRNVGAAEPDDAAGLSFAIAGIAETGTLVVAAGADNPVTHAFLPAVHIILVERTAIVGSYEAALGIVREKFGGQGMPRTLNYISGPSRTADIGGKIVIGAHGPRDLCVVVVG